MHRTMMSATEYFRIPTNRVVELGGQIEVLRPPRNKDIDRQMIVDLRRMLSRAT